MTSRSSYNFRTGTLSRRDDASRLEIIGALTEPDDPDAFSGYWLTVRIDDTAEPARIVAIELTEEPPADPPGYSNAPMKRLLAAGDPSVTPRGITARLLRSLPLALIRDAANEHLASRRDARGRLPDPTKSRTRDDRYYATWAAHYVRTAKTSQRPVADLAEQYGMDRAQIRDLLVAARTRGLLTSRGHGRGGGELTERGLAALGRKGAASKRTRAKRSKEKG